LSSLAWGMLSISVLGPVELRRLGERIPVPAGKPTEVLIRLALDAGVMVRTDRLIADLWGAVADTTARNTLQTKVSRLRRALGGAAVVSGGRSGYTLEVEPAAVDAIEVLRLAEATKDLLNAGAAESALETCTRALAMFRGEALCDAGEGDWLVPHRVRLEEARLGLGEDQLAVRLRLGATGEVIGELEALVALHPLREALWAQLITALYRDGRQADALEAYRRVRGRLAEELGVDPGAELQALEQQVLLQDPVLRAAGTARIETDFRRPDGNISTLSSELVGRDADLRELADLVTGHRLVTLVGPAGVGKTRLAIEVARGSRLADGAWLVRLENARTPASIPLALGEALTMSGATEAMVIDRLRASELLVILDNCEHLLDSVAALSVALLDSAPQLRVLVTSQVPLGIDGERVYPLAPLPLAASVTLFAQRAAERRRSFVLDPDAATAIEEVCRTLDGLPLAIELAAARTKALSVQEIARRLDDRFGLLSDPTSRRPERHRALGAAIAWSYDLLFPDEQRGLWALACFAGGAPVAAAEHVMAALGVPAASAVDVVGRLADRSLVAVDVGDAGAVRYRLLDSVRAFAIGRLDQAGLAEVACAAHAAWFATAASVAVVEQRGPGQGRHLAVVRVERANIDAALAWTADREPLLGLRIAAGFGWSSVIRGEGAVAAARLRSALRAADHLASPAERALMLSFIGWNEAGADIARARVESERAVEIADSSGDDVTAAESRFALAFVLIHQGQARTALQLLDEWRSAADHDNAPARSWDLAMTCVLVGYAGLAAGETARARAACEEAAGPLMDLDDDWLTSHIEGILGQLAQADHRLADAAVRLTRAADAGRRVGIPAVEGFHLASLGRVLQQAGDHQAAIDTLERAIELTRAVGLMRPVALAQVRLGRLLRGLGDTKSARSALVAADEWFRASGGGEEALLAECLLTAMDAEDAAPHAAERLATMLETARVADDLEVQVLTLDAQAALSAAVGRVGEARGIVERADALMPSAGHRIAESDRLDAARARSLIEAAAVNSPG
jgi:predicted ATPase/DNA-binding SARP family transcriptional activator/tetratricopeptide (TPR) repeat protein